MTLCIFALSTREIVVFVGVNFKGDVEILVLFSLIALVCATLQLKCILGCVRVSLVGSQDILERSMLHRTMHNSIIGMLDVE